ncbi:DUF1295-domain-containing protein [Hypoxylon trugodes]|uniref:DUF1295-domain-containing protein n=1 Tax=Hypoxylon trugodes TaxID=326681 RepID=UPI00218E9280|nr:DUF1295-domain-containing protein [Hypoxylon trugodes]KAI1384306.1 DUF1295-domain-containing protein [Hypoxylon trugodes]
MAGGIHVLDDYYLAITLLVTLGYQLLFFVVAFSFKFDKITDFAGGTNFVVLAILTLCLSQHPDPRQIIASVFIIAWGLRLSIFLLYRVLKTGKDDRFDGTRERLFAFLGFWLFQMIWVWSVSLPITILNSPAVRSYAAHQAHFGTARDIAGTVLFGVGFIMETVSDTQRYIWRKNDNGFGVCDKGFFAWSRHPNYFGEIIIQFGIYMICVSPAADGSVQGSAYKALYASILGPFFLLTLILFVSGLSLSERPGAKKRYEDGTKWDAYQRYLNRTSILIPFPPEIYEKLPTIIKRTIFLEFPIYVFDPAKHSDVTKDQQAAEEGQHRISPTNDRQSGEPLRENV